MTSWAIESDIISGGLSNVLGNETDSAHYKLKATTIINQQNIQVKAIVAALTMAYGQCF